MFAAFFDHFGLLRPHCRMLQIYFTKLLSFTTFFVLHLYSTDNLVEATENKEYLNLSISLAPPGHSSTELEEGKNVHIQDKPTSGYNFHNKSMARLQRQSAAIRKGVRAHNARKKQETMKAVEEYLRQQKQQFRTGSD